MYMIEEKVLQDLGLNDLEAKVYLAILALGEDTVLHISKEAGIKRPTCYVTLDNLLQKGLVSKIERKSTTLYAALEPKLLLNTYKEKIANFADMLPFFESKMSKAKRPRIRVFEGKKELDTIYTDYFTHERSSFLYFFGTNAKRITTIWPDFFEVWLKRRSQFKESKEIISNDEISIQYIKNSTEKYQIRLMPKDLEVFSDVVVSENAVFVVSLDNMIGVLIESEDLAKTFQNFFLLAWRGTENK